MTLRKALRLSEVREATGLSTSTIYEKMQRGLFPRPVKRVPDGRGVIWWQDEIETYQENLPRAMGGYCPRKPRRRRRAVSSEA